MTRTDTQDPEGGLVQRVEVLLSSLTAVVSARVVLDQPGGAHVHIIATDEVPVVEVSRAVMSALTWGLGLEVPSNNITVVQSKLSREELRSLLLRSEQSDPPPTPVTPGSPTPLTPETPLSITVENPPPVIAENPTPVAVESPTPVVAENPPTGSPAAGQSVADTGLLEFSFGGTRGETIGETEHSLRRLELQDLQLNKNPQGGFAISVRLADEDRSIGAEREAAGTEEDSLEVPASTALDVIQQFLRAGREDGPSAVFRFLAARRLRRPQHDVVVVVVEAVVRGRRIPLTGATSANDGVERASILATLQATNAFVAGTLPADSAIGSSAQ